MLKPGFPDEVIPEPEIDALVGSSPDLTALWVVLGVLILLAAAIVTVMLIIRKKETGKNARPQPGLFLAEGHAQNKEDTRND